MESSPSRSSSPILPPPPHSSPIPEETFAPFTGDKVDPSAPLLDEQLDELTAAVGSVTLSDSKDGAPLTIEQAINVAYNLPFDNIQNESDILRQVFPDEPLGNELEALRADIADNVYDALVLVDGIEEHFAVVHAAAYNRALITDVDEATKLQHTYGVVFLLKYVYAVLAYQMRSPKAMSSKKYFEYVVMYYRYVVELTNGASLGLDVEIADMARILQRVGMSHDDTEKVHNSFVYILGHFRRLFSVLLHGKDKYKVANFVALELMTDANSEDRAIAVLQSVLLSLRMARLENYTEHREDAHPFPPPPLGPFKTFAHWPFIDDSESSPNTMGWGSVKVSSSLPVSPRDA